MIFMEKTRMKFLIDPKIEETLLTESSKEKVQQEDNLKTAKQKMDEIKLENEKLKLRLSQVMEDYHSLQKQFNDEDNQAKKSTSASDDDDEFKFVSLSLGRSSVNYSNMEEKTKKKAENPDDGLELGLDCKFHSDNSTDKTSSKNEMDEKESKEVSTPCRRDSPKKARSGDDEILQQNPSSKKPRVSVRAFCNTQTMNDGCQWRKYGQKIAKGNPCPRAYYRCTIASSCPVRKQVQRCVDDMTILTTTYEGTHNHPLPPAATTMASTTSAAAAMLNCKSSSSSTTPPQPGPSTTTAGAFNLASSPYPNITISSTQSHPTVVLDLTVPNHYATNPSWHTTKFSPSSLFANVLSSSTSLNFSSSTYWFQPNNTPVKDTSLSPYSQPFVFNSYNAMAPSRQAANKDNIAAATKMITDNPSFQSALAAAITSFVGNKVQGRNSGLDFQLSFSQPSENKGNIGRTPDGLL